MIRKIVEATYGNMLDKRYKEKYHSSNNNIKKLEELIKEINEEEDQNATK